LSLFPGTGFPDIFSIGSGSSDLGALGAATSIQRQQQSQSKLLELHQIMQLGIARNKQIGLVPAEPSPGCTQVMAQRDETENRMLGAVLDGPDLLDFEATRLFDAADALEVKVEAHEADIQKRWNGRRDKIIRVMLDEAMERGRIFKRERDQARQDMADAAARRGRVTTLRRKSHPPSSSPFDRTVPGDDIAPPADVELLIRKDELLEKIGVPVGSEYRWCFAEKMAQYSRPHVDRYYLHCACDRGNYIKEIGAFGAPTAIHTVELGGHAVRLDNGHLRIVYLGRCDGCGRVHWFEVAREIQDNEIDNSVVVYCDPRNGKTYINGVWFSDFELHQRRTSR